MRKRSSVLALAMAAVIVLGMSDIPTLARSTCRVHRYFETLKSTDAPVSALERLLISLILANTPDKADRKS